MPDIHDVCIVCNTRKKIYVKGTCRTCFKKQPRYYKICKDCNQLKKCECKDLCDNCYKKRIIQFAAPLKKCECGCDEMIPSITISGKQARFKHGHNSRGENNPMYNGGVRIGKYVSIITDEKHINGRLKTKYYHRMVMEQVLGRKLNPDEDVHHKDKNKFNNDPSNLEVILKSEHTKFHNPRLGTGKTKNLGIY
jgi:hypothetical protein